MRNKSLIHTKDVKTQEGTPLHLEYYLINDSVLGGLSLIHIFLRCDSGRNLIYRYYEHTYSPYGRFGTRRLLRYTKFDSSCL